MAVTVVEVEPGGEVVEVPPLPGRQDRLPPAGHGAKGQASGITTRAMTSQVARRGSPNLQ